MKSKSILDKTFTYTPADQMGPGYLRKRFQAWQRELRRQATTAAPANVAPIKKSARRP